jgi:hypothetical protein
VISILPALVLAWAALVLVPSLLSQMAVPDRVGHRPTLALLASRLALPAAGLLVLSMWMTPGAAAAAMAAPWLVVALVAALHGLGRFARRGAAPLEEFAIDVGLVNLFIGALWAFAWRAEWPLMGYGPQWVVLTALHFHVAGFVLPLVASMLARTQPGPALAVGLVGLTAAVPLTAMGIAVSRKLELAASAVLTSAAVLVGFLAWSERQALKGPSRLLLRVAGSALVVSMPLAALYVTGSFPSVDAMLVSHGLLNAFVFGGCGVLAMRLTAPEPRVDTSGIPFSALAASGWVGSDYFARYRVERDVEGTSDVPHGLVDKLEDLTHPGFAAERVAPAIRRFYEHTDAHSLRVQPHWRAGFRGGARLWARLAGRMGQLQLPLIAERADDAIESRIVPLDDARDGRPGSRGWVRTFASDGRAMYVAAYAVHRYRGIAYMNIAFPLPRANLASILRMDPVSGDNQGDAIVLTTRNSRRLPGDAGIWLVLRLGKLTFPIKLPLSETIHVWTPSMPQVPRGLEAPGPASCVARHELRIMGIRYLTLDYVITPLGP